YDAIDTTLAISSTVNPAVSLIANCRCSSYSLGTLCQLAALDSGPTIPIRRLDRMQRSKPRNQPLVTIVSLLRVTTWAAVDARSPTLTARVYPRVVGFSIRSTPRCSAANPRSQEVVSSFDPSLTTMSLTASPSL